jgi:hypothetical protein
MSVSTHPCGTTGTSLPPGSPSPSDPDPRGRSHRIDGAEAPTGGRASLSTPLVAAVAWAALAGGLVLVGGGNADLGPAAARQGLAASEAFGPLGRVYGGWDPSLWPGRMLVSGIWALGEGGRASSASVRWPDAIAALGIGLILCRRVRAVAGARASLLLAGTLFGSVAMLHRGETPAVDLIAGLAVVGALDRLLGRGADWLAGAWLAAAFLAGGWPPVVLVLLPVVVLGRPSARLSAPLLAPLGVAAVGWSVWAIRVASPEAWGAALAFPLTQRPAWTLALGVAALALPATPLAALAGWRSCRSGWDDATRRLLGGWAQAAAVALLVGTLLPGVAPASRVVAVAAIAMAAALVLEGLWTGSASPAARRTALGLILALAVGWGAFALLGLGYLAAAVSYYRQVAILLMVVAVAILVLAGWAVVEARPRVGVAALALLVVSLKLAHWGVFVPESNYRLGQGPWGRAIGQWVPPNWPIYVVHSWRHDLLFHTERPVRQLPAPEVLNFKPTDRPHFVLLLESEFDHWPAHAPAIQEVRRFEDEVGRVRVLARTKGELNLTRVAVRND